MSKGKEFIFRDLFSRHKGKKPVESPKQPEESATRARPRVSRDLEQPMAPSFEIVLPQGQTGSLMDFMRMLMEASIPENFLNRDARLEEMGRISVKLANLVSGQSTGGERFQNVVFIDSSARGAAAGTSAALHEQGQPLPGMMFVNPDGLTSREDVVEELSRLRFEDPIALLLGGSTGAMKHLRRGSINDYRPNSSIRKEIEASYKGADRDQKTLIVDTCSHTGETLKTVYQGFAAAGFTDIQTAVISGDGMERCTFRPDYILMQGEEYIGGCYPFGKQNGREKGPRSVHTRANGQAYRHVTTIGPDITLSRADIRRAARTAVRNS